ncbi:MAG: ferritin family protein [Thermodesulfobacteriota bacterium]|nr:ferritin family protein [Thermodesulfobacteriota bacterium]
MDIEKYKNVISDAIENEIEAKEFYAKISKGIKDTYLQELFDDFSKEEAKHEKILTGILNQEKIQSQHFDFNKDFKVAETYEMPEVNDKMNLKEAIGLAMKNEEIAMKHYANLAENCDDPELKSIFLSLASMERAHKFKMEKSFLDIAYPEVW